MRTAPTLRMRRVFVDTSAYYALADPRDANHDAANTIAAGLVTHRPSQFTTNFILAETHALVLARRGRNVAARVLAHLDNSTMVRIRVSAKDERRAREIIATYSDKAFTLTDATSFAVMDRLHIPYAFTFDDDFAQYGFSILTPGTLP